MLRAAVFAAREARAALEIVHRSGLTSALIRFPGCGTSTGTNMQISAQLAGEASVANAAPSSSRCMRTGSLAVLGQMQTWRTRARTARTGSARLTNGMAVRKHLSYSRARTRQALAQVLERLNRDQTQICRRVDSDTPKCRATWVGLTPAISADRIALRFVSGISRLFGSVPSLACLDPLGSAWANTGAASRRARSSSGAGFRPPSRVILRWTSRTKSPRTPASSRSERVYSLGVCRAVPEAGRGGAARRWEGSWIAPNRSGIADENCFCDIRLRWPTGPRIQLRHRCRAQQRTIG